MKKMFRWILLISLLFTFTLTAGSHVFAALNVNVMPSGSTSQTNIWDSKGPYTWPGNTLELWGNVSYDGSGTLTYVWDFGAGQGTVAGTVTNRNNISASHAYLSTGSFVATLTVTDGTESDTDTVFIDVVTKTQSVEKNLAIQKGLKYLYTSKGSTTVNGCTGYYWNTNPTAGTGLALMAFMNHGHLEINDPDGDIYAKTVENGLNYYFYHFNGQVATDTPTTPMTDSDINGNGRKVYGYTNNLYHVGISAMTVAATLTPDAIVRDCASAEISGKTYKEVLEDLVDFIAYAQQEGTSGYAGGWRYHANYGSSDGSVTQWPVLGLGEAQNPPWNINAPAWVKTRMGIWGAYDQNDSSGGFGYTNYNEWVNVAKTGAGIAGLVYSSGAGDAGGLARAIGYISTNWGATGYDYGNIGDHYAMYAVKKGMEYAGLSTVGTHDWQAEYDRWLIDNQNSSGYWPASVRIDAGQLSCEFGLLVLAPLEACKPLANAGGDQELSEGQQVIVNATASAHSCPDTGSLVSFQWDFDYDGINFDVDATGPIAINYVGYSINNGTDTQNFIVGLKVIDNDGKTSTDTLIVTVSNGNAAPVANPGGPYLGAVGEDIVLNGSASTDENIAGGANPIGNPATSSGFDEIMSYQWDIDGDNLYGSEDSPSEPEGVSPVVNFGADFIGTKTVGLKVTDSFGKTAAQSSVATTVAISNLFPISYELVSNSYNRRTGLWTVTWKMNIINTGNAEATAVTAVLTPASIPPGVTVTDDSLQWTVPDGTIDANEIQLSDDTFQYRYPKGISGPDITQMTWDIEFTDALGTRHIVRNIPQ
ncbi:MAG: PKD domain-containing protein [Pseudomonadota bacterium]